MSPNKLNLPEPISSKSELIEMPDWGKSAQESEPLKTAKDLTASAEGLDATQRLELMTGYIASIEALARSGDIKSDNGNGRSYGVEEVQQQLSEFVQELNSPTMSLENRKKLIPRAGDLKLRDNFESLINNEVTARALMDAITARQIEIAAEQAKPTKSIGGNALSLAGIADPAERAVNPLSELTSGLDSDDISQLRSYSDALLAKKDAQRRGDGEGSTLLGQAAGDALRAMKPNVKLIANRYASMHSNN